MKEEPVTTVTLIKSIPETYSTFSPPQKVCFIFFILNFISSFYHHHKKLKALACQLCVSVFWLLFLSCVWSFEIKRKTKQSNTASASAGSCTVACWRPLLAVIHKQSGSLLALPINGVKRLRTKNDLRGERWDSDTVFTVTVRYLWCWDIFHLTERAVCCLSL